MLNVNTKLSELRKALTDPKVSQEQLAQQARMSRQWLHLLESGKQSQISYTTGINLLSAINVEREKRSMPAIALDQLELRIV